MNQKVQKFLILVNILCWLLLLRDIHEGNDAKQLWEIKELRSA